MSDLQLREKAVHLVPRRRKDSVDHEALNAEATGERFELTPEGRAALDEPEFGADENSDAAMMGAVEGNLDTVFQQQRKIRDLEDRLAELSAEHAATGLEFQATVRHYERANEGLRTERAHLVSELATVIEQRDGALAQVADLLAENLKLTQQLNEGVTT